MRPIRPRRAPFAIPALVLLLLAAGAVAGCKGATPIRDILDDPSRFRDKTVKIAGTVSASIGVFGTGVYEVDDGTGKLPVVARGGGVPREGAKVGVEGKVQPGFTLGDKTLTVLMEDKRVTP